jgi:hypothetical protein
MGPNFERWHRRAPKNLDKRVLAEAFVGQRIALLRRSPTYSKGPKERAHGRRLARRLKQQMLRKVGLKLPGKTRKAITSPAILLYRIPQDIVRDSLVPDFRARWIDIPRRLKNRTVHDQDLRRFSFKRDPQATMSQLATLIRASAQAADIRLHFVDSHCDDIAPYVLLAKLRAGMPPIISGGRLNRDLHEVIDAVGLKRALQIAQVSAPLPNQTSVSAFRMFSRVPPGAFGDKEHLLRPQYKEIIADHFCDTLNGWLRGHGLELTATAESKIVASFGEGLDNAERHGDLKGEPGTGDWSVAGFSRLWEDGEGRQTLECSVAMVSIGTTISESLETAGAAVARRIDDYTARHSSYISGPADRELLRTVMALQDGVTRVESAFLGRRGGVGLMELINTFAELGDNEDADSQSVVTIISGNACVRMTGDYRAGRAGGGTELRELWFNPANDATSPPDRNHVFSLAERFPGTILSACFTIDPTYLRKKLAL